MAVEKKEEVLENEELDIQIEESDEEEGKVEAQAETEQASSEDEHEQYSEGVKKRIDRLTYKMREAERREQAALDFAKKNNQRSLLGDVYNLLGINERYQGNQEAALAYYHQAIPYFEELNDSYGIRYQILF